MRPTALAALAFPAIAMAPGPAAAVEEKSTKPRIAVIEFAGKAGAPLAVDSVQWGEWIADVERPRLAAQGEKGGTEDINIGIGELQEGPGGDPDRPVISGSVPNPGRSASVPQTGDEVLVGMEQGDPASGQSGGRRQHGAITITKEWDAATPQLRKLERPAARGSVWIRMAQPLTSCRVGDRFNGVYLTTGVTHKYRLDGARIVGCGGSTVTINYTRFASVGAPVR